MVRGFAGGVKPDKRLSKTKGIAKGTLPFCSLGLTNVREKARMRGAKLSIVDARLTQAELAVHRQADFAGILVFLSVVLPPADRAQLQCARHVERSVSTARAKVTNFDRYTHIGIDVKMTAKDYAMWDAFRHLHGLLILAPYPANGSFGTRKCERPVEKG